MKKSVRSILFFLVLFSAPFFANGLADEKPLTDQFLSEFEELKTRLANVEKQQQEIVTKDNEILDKLDQLRIWVRRK